MKNSAFIKLNGQEDSQYIDIFTEYGVSFLKGSYLTLLKKSSSKGYVENDSRLQHGVQMVAKAKYARYQKRSLSVTILLEASNESQFSDRFEAFQDKISQGLFLLKIPSKSRVFKLVYNDLKIKQEFRFNMATFTLELTEPNPEDRIKL